MLRPWSTRQNPILIAMKQLEQRPSRLLVWLTTAFPALIFCAASTHGEVLKSLNSCGQQLCASYQLALTPPEGWVVDAKASSENKVQIMVPKGQSFATAEPLIYVQVFYHADKQQTLADIARARNARWLAANARATISDLPPVHRANSNPPLLRLSFLNPRKTHQAQEIGAVCTDSDQDRTQDS